VCGFVSAREMAGYTIWSKRVNISRYGSHMGKTVNCAPQKVCNLEDLKRDIIWI
jgi:hypothetical protein